MLFMYKIASKFCQTEEVEHNIQSLSMKLDCGDSHGMLLSSLLLMAGFLMKTNLGMPMI